MGHARRVAMIGHDARQSIGEAKPTLGASQQHHAAVRGQPSAIESGDDFLAFNRWKEEWRDRTIGHGGCGSRRNGVDLVSTPKLYSASVRYATSPSPKSLLNE